MILFFGLSAKLAMVVSLTNSIVLYRPIDFLQLEILEQKNNNSRYIFHTNSLKLLNTNVNDMGAILMK